MQMGLYLAGDKGDILVSLDRKIEAEKAKFALLCSDYKVHTGWNLDHTIATHESKPIEDKYSKEILDLIGLHFREQLDDLDENEECSVAFQITIQRRNPR